MTDSLPLSDPSAPNSESLAGLRVQIDSLDQQLLGLLNQRAHVAEQVGEIKKREGTPFFRPDRVAQVIEKMQHSNAGPLKDLHVAAIWREIMSASFALERPLTICHFGQQGAFTHLAARLKFGESVTYTHVESIATVFSEVEKGHADYGVVPIENSTDGAITDTIDAFLATHLRIINELHLRVRHHLMSKVPRDQVRRIYSRHTVFGQCRNWLAANMPGVELVELVSTTKAAERAVEADLAEGAAAIGNSEAATAFSLPLLASDIQDNPNNITRFVVIGTPERAAQPTGSDKTSLFFGVQDRPGALYDCLLPFHRSGINLGRIESRPSRRRFPPQPIRPLPHQTLG